MNEYWRQREEQAQREYQLTEEQYVAELNSIYDYMLDQIKKEINGFYSKYATAEGITMAEAQQRTSQLDIEEYERKAKKYVEEKDFSAQANQEMRLYNLTMRVNRLQLLEANIGLETVSGFDELNEKLGEDLSERAVQEMRRQAGILGKTVQDNAKKANSIVGASFHNAKFSDRIWMYQAQLRDELDSLLRNGLIQGWNPNEMARHIDKLFDTGKYNCERLLRTELTRVQSDAQLESFTVNGFEWYQFNALGDACKICAALDEKHFKISEAMPGENLPPIHPNCVTADTKIIAPGAEAIMRSQYSGDIVEIRTANGTRLGVTPNHIVLTARGWVRAKNLVKGDKVVHYCGDVGDGAHTEPADDNCAVTIEDLFTAVIETSGSTTLRVPATAVDLKGDVIPDSEINIIPIDGKLWNKLDPTERKLLSDGLLVGTGKLGERELPFNSTIMAFLSGISLVADGVMSGLRVSEVLLRGALGHREFISLRRSADYDARLQKTATDSRPTNPELFGNSVFADTGIVKPDNFGCIEVKSNSVEGSTCVLDSSFDSGAVDSEFLGDSLSRHSSLIEVDDFANIATDSNIRLDAMSDEGIVNNMTADAVNIGDFVDCFPSFVEFDDIEFVSIRKNFVGHVYDTSCITTLHINNGIIASNCRCAVSAWMDDALYNEWLNSYQNHGLSYEDWLNNRPTAVEAETESSKLEWTPASTLDEAKEYAEDTLGFTSTYYYDKLSLDFANMLNQQATEIYNTFGNLSEGDYLTGVRKVKFNSDDTVAAYSLVTHEVMFKTGSKSALKSMAAEAKEEYAMGCWSTSAQEHVIRHELGHAVEQMVKSDSDKMSEISALRESLSQTCNVSEWSVADAVKNSKTAGEYLSYYGLRNDSEFIAESIAEYMNGEARETAQAVVDIILR